MTNAKPEIAEHEFTTTKVEVGIMDYGGVKIQVLEIPAMHKDFSNKGLGPTYLSLIRNSDLIIILLDLTANVDEQGAIMEKEFEKAKIRLNKEEPPVIIRKTAGGGINFIGKQYFRGEMDEAMKIFRDNAVHNADI